MCENSSSSLVLGKRVVSRMNAGTLVGKFSKIKLKKETDLNVVCAIFEALKTKKCTKNYTE